VSAVVADTQAVVWYLTEPTRLSEAAVSAMDAATASGSAIHVASITLVELRYLIEKKKLPATVLEWLTAELDDAESAFELVALTREVAEAMGEVSREAVPDMPDRIIAATAHQMGLPLVTSDRQIRASGVSVIW
jgi:PIN domain nuclease of toxin-antitoxin system